MASAQLFCAVTGTLMVVVFPAVTREVLDVVVEPGLWVNHSDTLLRATLETDA